MVKAKKKTAQKTFKFGMEIELFTLDNNGKVISGADKLIKHVNQKYSGISMVKECGKNMIELNSFPHTGVVNVMEAVMNDFESVLYAAEKEDILVYPLATYPGAFTPEMRQEKGYKVKEQIFGKQKFSIAGRCIGLHCHYTLPKGVFDISAKTIKNLIYSKHKESMVNIYNLFIAMDPALTTFTQSSPFYQGKHIGKDSRMIVYRGGKALDYPAGLYANYQTLGGLQPYKYTGLDLIKIIETRFSNWEKIIKDVDMNLKSFAKHGSMLDTTWNPVKINAHGTIEQRGMDMNYPEVIVPTSLIIKYIARLVQEKFVKVVPSDIGISEPFKKEGNTIYIPPHTHVRFEMQKKAAYQGLDDPDVLQYCKNLLKLGKFSIPKNRMPLLKPLQKMIDEKKTVSDRILEYAKKQGMDIKKGLTPAQGAEIAVHESRSLFKDLILTKKALKDYGS